MTDGFVRGKAGGDPPIHQLTQPLTAAWIAGGNLKRAIAARLSSQYPAGCLVATISGRVIGTVSGNGMARDLPPPFRLVHKHQLSNALKPDECYCGDWYYPETKGPWKLTGSKQHHPLCFFDESSRYVADHADCGPKAAPNALQLAREAYWRGR